MIKLTYNFQLETDRNGHLEDNHRTPSGMIWLLEHLMKYASFCFF